MARVEPIHYTGIVWCVKVETGAFVARRNGKAFVTGNSGFPKSLNVQKFLLKQAKQETSPETKAHLEEKSNDFNGFGSALKPAWEPVVVGVKPC